MKDGSPVAMGHPGPPIYKREHEMTDDLIIKIYHNYYPQSDDRESSDILPFARALLNAHERSLLSQVMPLLLAHELAKAPGIKQDQ